MTVEEQPVIPYECKCSRPLLEDLYGDKKFKESIEDIVLSMETPMLYSCFGAKVPKSYLLYGPPGTGKTYSVNAIANELGLKKNPKKVLMIPYSIGTYGTAYINMGSKNLQKVFDTGLEIITDPKLNVDSIVYFFDEADAIMGKRREHNASKEDDKLLETLMTNLQDINLRDTNEYIFMVTNFKEALDPASIRSGRVDRQIEFKLPDYDTRVALLESYIKRTNDIAGYKVIRNYDPRNIVDKTEGFNFADMEAIVMSALDSKIRKELRNKPKGIIPAYWIGEKQLIEARDIIKTKYNKIQEKRRIGFQI